MGDNLRCAQGVFERAEEECKADCIVKAKSDVPLDVDGFCRLCELCVHYDERD